MSSRAKLVWSTLGLSLLVLLPFMVHSVLFYLEEQRVRERGSGPMAELIARRQYEQAYRLAGKADGAELPQQHREQLSFQLAICERLLDKPAQAYERLYRLQGALPVLEDYRRFWMASALQDMDEHEAAIGAYEDFLLTSGHKTLSDSVHLRLASLYVEAERYEQALQTYQRLQQRLPGQVPELFYHMAQAHEAWGDQAAARQMRLQLMQDHPAHQRALKVLDQLPRGRTSRETYASAVVYFRHGQYRQAAKTLKSFLDDYPQHQLAEEAHFLLGRAYWANRQYANAQKAFSAVYEHYGRPSALYRIGSTLVRRNRDAKAIETYQKFARSYPQHELADKALWQAAKAAERNNKFARAEQLYKNLTTHYPHSQYRDDASWSIGFMHYCRDQHEAALEIFQELSRKAAEPHIVDQSLFWVGKAAGQLGLQDKSRVYYNQAARGFPRSYYSARAISLGFSEDAHLQPRSPAVLSAKAADLARPQGAQYLQRADALRELGLLDLAEGELVQVEHLNRGDIPALKVIRDRYEALGSLDRALYLSGRIFAHADEQSEFYRLYPDYYWNQVVKAAREAQIDPYLVLSVIRQESSFRKDAVSHAGAIGLMQIMPQTGRVLARQLGLRRFQHNSLFDPDVSIRLGSRFLGDQVRRFMEGPTKELGFELGLAAYNAGPHVARKWTERFSCEDPDKFVERIPYKETRLYVKLVLKNYTIYKALSEV